MLRILLDCLRILNKSNQKKYLATLLLQALLSILDLLGVAILGVVGAIAIRGVQSLGPGDRTAWLLKFVHLSEFSLQTQVAILGTSAMTFLVGRTFLTMIITRRISHFLSSQAALLSIQLISKKLANENHSIGSQNAAGLQYILGPGVSAITVGILGSLAAIVGDFFVLLVVTFGVIAINPEIALFSALIFGSVGLILYFKLHVRAQAIGKKLAEHTIESDKLIAEIIHGNKEIYVRSRQSFYLEQLSVQKNKLAYFYAENSFLPNIGKYVIEITVIVGAVVIAASQFLRQDASNAVAGLAIFLVAGTRLAPALLRLQQGFVSIKSHLGAAAPTIEALNLVQELPELETGISIIDRTHFGFFPSISISRLEFNYLENPGFSLWVDELEILPGEIVAIVGPSGSGKSTLLDLLLGILMPTSGVIKISGETPASAIKRWPGAIGYVPQEIYLSDKSLLENIGMGYRKSDVELKYVEQAIENAQLKQFVREQADGLETLAGDRGTRLSGGQRQRLGIARSLYTNPKLLILDEATSALDGVIEKEVSDAISNLKTRMTVVLIAHRLSTVTMADRVIYMNAGKIEATGSFSEVRTKVPDFDKQAKLSGL